MKPNNHPGGTPASRGAINWGGEIACLLIMVSVAGTFAVWRMPIRSCGVSKLSQVESDFKSFDSALAMYKLNGGNYPSNAQGLKALVEKPSDHPVPVRWVPIMPKTPLDSWGQPYLYQFPGSKNPEEWEIVSQGPDGLAGTGDDLSSQDE